MISVGSSSNNICKTILLIFRLTVNLNIIASTIKSVGIIMYIAANLISIFPLSFQYCINKILQKIRNNNQYK